MLDHDNYGLTMKGDIKELNGCPKIIASQFLVIYVASELSSRLFILWLPKSETSAALWRKVATFNSQSNRSM